MTTWTAFGISFQRFLPFLTRGPAPTYSRMTLLTLTIRANFLGNSCQIKASAYSHVAEHKIQCLIGFHADVLRMKAICGSVKTDVCTGLGLQICHQHNFSTPWSERLGKMSLSCQFSKTRQARIEAFYGCAGQHIHKKLSHHWAIHLIWK